MKVNGSGNLGIDFRLIVLGRGAHVAPGAGIPVVVAPVVAAVVAGTGIEVVAGTSVGTAVVAGGAPGRH